MYSKIRHIYWMYLRSCGPRVIRVGLIWWLGCLMRFPCELGLFLCRNVSDVAEWCSAFRWVKGICLFPSREGPTVVILEIFRHGDIFEISYRACFIFSVWEMALSFSDMGIGKGICLSILRTPQTFQPIDWIHLGRLRC